MTQKIECPVCGVVRMEPRPIVRTTPWNDDCTCSDYSTCFYHRSHPYEPSSMRPDEAVMEARAAEANEAALTLYEEQKAKFAEAADFVAEIQRLKDALALANQVSGELCEKCGWAMKFPGEPCRCELAAELDSADDDLILAVQRLTARSEQLQAERETLQLQLEAALDRSNEGVWMARALDAERQLKTPQYVFRGGYIEDESGDRWWSAGLLAKVEAERDTAFSRGVAAMREALAEWAAMAFTKTLTVGDIRAYPDPEDKS